MSVPPVPRPLQGETPTKCRTWAPRGPRRRDGSNPPGRSYLIDAQRPRALQSSPCLRRPSFFQPSPSCSSSSLWNLSVAILFCILLCARPLFSTTQRLLALRPVLHRTALSAWSGTILLLESTSRGSSSTQQDSLPGCYSTPACCPSCDIPGSFPLCTSQCDMQIARLPSGASLICSVPGL